MLHAIRSGLPLVPLAGAFSFMYMIVFSPTGLTPLASGDPLALTPREQTLVCVAWMAVVGTCLLAGTVAHGGRWRTAVARMQCVLGIVLPFAGGVCALAWYGPFTPLAVALLLGLGCMDHLCLGARAGSRVEPSHMAIGTACALIAAAGISCIAVTAFPHEHLGTALVAFVCAACGCALAAQDRRTVGRRDGSDGLSTMTSGHTKPSDLLLLRYDGWALAGGIVCALSFGISWNEPAAGATASLAPQLVAGKAAGALILAVAFVHLDAHPESRSFDYALAIAAFSALAFWLMDNEFDSGSAPFVVASFSQVLFIGLLWVETAYTGRDLADPEVLPLVGVVAFLAAYALGALLSFAVPSAVSTPCVPLGFLAFAFGLCLHGLRGSEKTERPARYDRSWEEALALLAQTYGLSQREREILPFLVLGLSTTTVGERLFVSPQTVKSHAHRIYAKMGIHSHDELVALFEKCAPAIGTGPTNGGA